MRQLLGILIVAAGCSVGNNDDAGLFGTGSGPGGNESTSTAAGSSEGEDRLDTADGGTSDGTGASTGTETTGSSTNGSSTSDEDTGEPKPCEPVFDDPGNPVGCSGGLCGTIACWYENFMISWIALAQEIGAHECCLAGECQVAIDRANCYSSCYAGLHFETVSSTDESGICSPPADECAAMCL